MVVVKYKACCPFCDTLHSGEIEMEYRKDNKFNVRKNNKNVHLCENKECKKEFAVEIDSYGCVVSRPTKKIAEEEHINPWDNLKEGKIVQVKDN